jgi:DNA-binding transcriptional LysR family regulator
MFTPRQIEMVQVLARRRHFGLAAKELGMSQPSLTRSLKLLEAELGARLFDRQGVAPTLFGEIVLRHGARALAEFDEIAREIALAKGLEIGDLSIAAGLYPADISAERALGLLIEKHPRLRVDFRAMNWESAARQVLDGSVDLGFAELPGAPASEELDVETIRMSQGHFFCRADHPLLRKSHVTAEDIFSYPWVGPSMPGRISTFLPAGDLPCGYFDAASDKFRCRVLVGSFSSAKAAVRESFAICGGIPFQIEREIREGALAVIPFEAPWLRLNYGFMLKRGRTPSPAAIAFMDIVRGIESTIPP